jgi:hypothetical protein
MPTWVLYTWLLQFPWLPTLYSAGCAQWWMCKGEREHRRPPPYAHLSTEGNFLKYFAAGDTTRRAERNNLSNGGASYVYSLYPMIPMYMLCHLDEADREKIACNRNPFLFNKLSTLIRLEITTRNIIEIPVRLNK